MKPDPEHRCDKLALFVLAGMIVTVLGGMVAGTFWKGILPDKGDVLLGSIATGLILFLRDLVTAVRTSWEGATWSKMTDQLGAAAAVPKDPDVAETERK